MGDIADAMLSGLFCEGCGEFIDGEEPGFPRYCSEACAPAGSEGGDDDDGWGPDLEGFNLDFEVAMLRVALEEGRACDDLSPAAVKLLDGIEAVLAEYDASISKAGPS